VWVHVSIMHCSFEIFQVTLPLVLLLRTPPVGRPRERVREETEDGEKAIETTGRREEEEEEEKGEEKDLKKMKMKKAGRKAYRGSRWSSRRQARITSIARPPTKPSFFAEVPRSVGRPQRQQAAPYHFLHLVGCRRRHGHRLPPALPCIVANEGQSV